MHNISTNSAMGLTSYFVNLTKYKATSNPKYIAKLQNKNRFIP